MSHSRFSHCLQSDESHWRECASVFLPFSGSRLPRSHFIPFFRVPAIVPSFLLYGIKYQAARHNVPLSFWVPFISFSPLPAANPRRCPPLFAKSLCYRRPSRRARKIALNVADRFSFVKRPAPEKNAPAGCETRRANQTFRPILF